MVTKALIEDFLSQQRLAVVGVSRSGKKFGNTVFKNLRTKGYQVFPVNPNTEKVDGESCYPDLNTLPQAVNGVVIVVPPEETEKVVRSAAKARIRRVWMQQGSESEEAIRFCRENGIQVIYGECILMFAEPMGFPHRLHRWIWSLLGKLPK